MLLVLLVTGIAVFPAGRLLADAYDAGMAALARGDSGSAVTAFRAALAELPAGGEKRIESLFRLAQLESRLGERTRLLEEIVATGAGHPRRGPAALELVALHLSGNRLADAARIALPLRLDRQWREAALVALARIALAGRRLAEASGWLDAFFREFPRSEQADRMLFCRGEVFRLGNDRAQASRAYHAVLERHPASAAAAASWLALGEMASETGDALLAADCFGKLVKAFPQSVEASLARGRLHVLQGERQRTKELAVFEVQFAVFLRRDQAERFSSTLATKGYISFIHEETVRGQRQFSVRMGYFRSQADAESVRRELAGKGHPGFIRSRTVTVAEGDFG